MKLDREAARRIVYASPYYDPNVFSGANLRLDEITKRFARDASDSFTLIVARGKAPAWWTSGCGTLIEVDYRFDHPSKFSAAREIGKALERMPPSIVIIESVPIPYRALKQHAHFQVVYDFRYFTGDSKGFFYRLLFSSYLRSQWKRAEFMVTCSEFSIGELQRYVGFDPERVVKSYFGIEPKLLEQGDVPHKKTLDLLYTAHFEKRKNHEVLLRAIALVDKDLRVLLTGADNGMRSELEALAKNLGLTGTRFGRVSHEDLWKAYRSTRLYISPSVYEGFGIPLIEGLAFGAPVAASDIPVFHEIGGGLVTYFDPFSPEDIARAIKKQFARPHIPSRDAVRAQLEKFYWENVYQKFRIDLLAQATGNT